MQRSITLEKGSVRLIGRQLVGRVLLPDLYMGITVKCFNAEGNTPLLKQQFIKGVRTGAIALLPRTKYILQ